LPKILDPFLAIKGLSSISGFSKKIGKILKPKSTFNELYRIPGIFINTRH